jgi:hypothetical protein
MRDRHRVAAVFFPVTLLAALQPIVLAQRCVRGRRQKTFIAITACRACRQSALSLSILVYTQLDSRKRR